MKRKEQAGKGEVTAKAFTDFLGTLTLGDSETHENMTVFPVFTTSPQRDGYSLLDEAVKTGKFTITEATEGGRVPYLKVANDLDLDVLILDGDILVGAKQNRSATTTIVVAKKTETVIDVNCVEQGRWSYKGRHFGASDRPVYANLRAVKARSVSANLRAGRSYAADQGEVWNNINEKSAKFSMAEPSFAASRTNAADEMYESFDEKIKEYGKSFRVREGQIGFVVVIGGRVAGCDVFGNAGVLSRVYAKGLRSYVLDAVEKSYDKTPKKLTSDPRRKAAAFLSGLRKMSPEAFPSTGKGVNVRFESRSSNGFAAIDRDQVVHMAAFRSEVASKSNRRGPRGDNHDYID